MHAALTLDDIVRHLSDLPSLPAVVLELLASTGREDVDLQRLASQITRDQSLTAKTLRLANSSFYGMPSKVTSIQQAVAVLGLHNIRTLVTACAIIDSLAPGPQQGFDFPAFWRHSVATAVAARALAPHLRQHAETAFTAGLLHDIGRLVLATRCPEQYQAALAHRARHDCPMVDAERAIFGLDHTVVGGSLATYWKFPATIVSAVASHHNPAEQDIVSLPLTVHVANILAHALDLSGQEDDLVPPLSQRAWRTLALNDAACLNLFREIELGFQDMCQILVG